MGRKREFDTDEAVVAAMRLFWRRGYAKTGINELLDELAISRSSLYKAFNTKADLFCEALNRYERDEVDPMIELLAGSDGPAFGRVRAVFLRVVEKAQCAERSGCLLCNTAAEEIEVPQVSELVQRMFGRISRGFRIATKAFVRDQAEPIDDAQIGATADALTVFYSGLQIMVRSGMPVERLRIAVDRQLSEILGTNAVDRM